MPNCFLSFVCHVSSNTAPELLTSLIVALSIPSLGCVDWFFEG